MSAARPSEGARPAAHRAKVPGHAARPSEGMRTAVRSKEVSP